ncbi:MAG: YgaP family membrane protein [Ferruginibacter sp.]
MREKIIRVTAGSMVLLSITLALTVHIYWIGLAGFVGINLIQSVFTGFCPLEKILKLKGIQ